MFLEVLAASAVSLLFGGIIGGFVLYLLRERILLGWKDRAEQQAIQRERAAAVADLMAKWIAPTYGVEESGDLHRWELQREYWRVALWLDSDTLASVRAVLAHRSGSVSDAVAAARSAIIGPEKEPVTGDQLNRWVPLDEH